MRSHKAKSPSIFITKIAERVPCCKFANVDRLLFAPGALLALVQPTTMAERSRRGPRPRLVRE